MEKAAVDQVLVLRALGLGDLLVAVPALRGLRRAHPGSRIVLAAPRALGAVATWSGAVDEVLPTEGPDTLRWAGPAPPAVAVNLHGTGPQSHRALDATHPRRRIGFRPAGRDAAGWEAAGWEAAGWEAAGWEAAGWEAAGWDGPDHGAIAARYRHERDRWCALLAAFEIPADPADLALTPPAPRSSAAEAPVLVHPGAQYGAKRWPPRRYAAVAAALDRQGHRVVLTGSAAERPLALRVAREAGLPAARVLAGGTDVAQLAALVAGAALLVCGDTGVAHLASAFGTPSVVLFGPVPPARWGPPVDGPHVVLTDAAARRGDPFAADPDPALLGVGVADVLGAARVLRAVISDGPR